MVAEIELTSTECGRSAFNFAACTLGQPTIIYSIKNARQMAKAWAREGAGIHVIAHIPSWFRLFPTWWTQRSIVDRAKFCALVATTMGQDPFAIIHCVSGRDVYGLNVAWSHFVAEAFAVDGTRNYFDPFAAHLFDEYPEFEIGSYRAPSHVDLMNMIGLKLMLHTARGM